MYRLTPKFKSGDGRAVAGIVEDTYCTNSGVVEGSGTRGSTEKDNTCDGMQDAMININNHIVYPAEDFIASKRQVGFCFLELDPRFFEPITRERETQAKMSQLLSATTGVCCVILIAR
jgi:hypothetical protein